MRRGSFLLLTTVIAAGLIVPRHRSKGPTLLKPQIALCFLHQQAMAQAG